MKKLIFTALLAALVVPWPAAVLAGQSATGVTARSLKQSVLKSSVKVEDDIIRLGDLFTNTGEQADIGIAYAPDPGKRAVFDARWLYRVARAYRLNWKPMSKKVRVTVERASVVISREEIEDEILAALLEKGVEPGMNVELNNRMLRLYVPSDSLASLAVEDVVYEPRTRRFTAIISAPAGSPAAQRVRLTGRLHRFTNVPVPARRLLSGEIIAKNDIKWIKVRSDRLQPDIVVDEADLIGMAPRRGLKDGLPVRTSAVRRPILVQKGSLVTIILKAPQMMLTAQGKALEHGSDGDTIRVTNTQSSTTVEAEVIGTGRVAVRPTTLLALNR